MMHYGRTVIFQVTQPVVVDLENLIEKMSFYFDISDLVEYAKTNGEVSGIQRVQVSVLRNLATEREIDDIFCAYGVKKETAVKVCRVSDLFTNETYSASQLLLKLGIEKQNAAFSREELYSCIAKYKKRSITRMLQKAKFLILGRLFPRYARTQMNLPPRSEESVRENKKIRTWTLKKCAKHDHVVMIGTNWNTSAVENIARQHAKRGGRVSQAIYDLLPIRCPQYFNEKLHKKFSAFLNRSRSFASQYICISEATKNDVLDYLSDMRSDVPVKAWPLAHEFEGYQQNEKCLESTQPEHLKKIRMPFVLCVGTIEVRKNGFSLLKVWQQLLKELGDKTPQLVFAGKYGWKIEAFKKLLQEDLSLQQAVTIIPQATDADLATLYQRCLFFVYPSLAEGWGLPVGEAAWFGKYSVVSSSSSLPEVCGELVDYVDPSNITEITQSIKRAILEEEYRKQREKNIAQASLRTWKDVALHLNQLLHI